MRIAVIDTGVTPHPRLGRVIPGGDYVSDGVGLDDCDAHGTLVAGIIAARPSTADAFVGVAPAASIISIRQSSSVLRAESPGPDGPTVGAGVGTLSTLARSIRAAVDNLRATGLREASAQMRQLILFDRAATARDMGVMLVLNEQGDIVDDIDAGLAVVDAYAAEHLEVITADAAAVAARVRNAGAIFVGAHSPVSLGDYAAGSNHVLPTAGSARFASGLSVQSFLRGIHVVEYDAAALAEVAPHVVALADSEDLPAHGEAVRARTGEDG